MWDWYSAHTSLVNPIAAFAGALGAFITAAAVAWTGVQNSRIARLRHEAQTEADRRRRITESFSKAIDQLASDEPMVRLGGIFTMERISQESCDDYWPVMETLTAFVRHHAPWCTPDIASPERPVTYQTEESPGSRSSKPKPAPDIAAVLMILRRRSTAARMREQEQGWQFNLGGIDLRGANLGGVHLERAGLLDAHLEGAILEGAHLEKAYLGYVYFNGSIIKNLHLNEATLDCAHFEGLDLRSVRGLTGPQLAEAYGDAKTRLPAGVERPAQWPALAPWFRD